MLSFKAVPYFDGKFVSIGRCVDGVRVLDLIEAVDTRFERPLREIVVVDIGVLEG
jgi:cyclophilin family peptidyl-prolyl cis-trans isomerase